MNNARMTFRFNENKQDKKLESGRIKSSDNLKLSKESATANHAASTEIESVHSLEAPITMQTQNRTSLPLEERQTTKPPKESAANNIYFDRRIYDDWEEPFGPYSAAPIIADKENKEHQIDSYEELDMQEMLYSDRASDNYTLYHRPRNGWKLFGSIIAAVVTGVMFGVVAMSMVNTEQSPSSSPAAVPAASDITSSQAVTESGAAAASGGVSAGLSTAVEIPAVTYFMLQYGVFSNKDGAEQAKSELTTAGIAAGSDPLDELRVYAGVSKDRGDARQISNQLKAEGVELYVREISLPAVSSIQYTGEQEAVSEFFNNSREITEILTSISIEQLGQTEQTAVPADKMTSITDVHQRWTSSVAAVRSGLPADSEAVELAMEAAMNTAVAAIAEYNKNPSKEHMWNVQSQVMGYILLEKQLLEIIKQA
ncbi:SPOR domain-containing protein [Neobacillus mesonae]|nr:SPOR domain-containing protein [Neobacillus mesonae]